jgi:hypothetical protein
MNTIDVEWSNAYPWKIVGCSYGAGSCDICCRPQCVFSTSFVHSETSDSTQPANIIKIKKQEATK